MIVISTNSALWLAVVQSYRREPWHDFGGVNSIIQWLAANGVPGVTCQRGKSECVQWEVSVPDHLYLVMVLKYGT